MTPLAFDGSILTLAKGEGIRWKLFRHKFPPEGRKLQIVVKLSCFEVQDNVVVVESLSHVQLFYNTMDCSPPGSSVHGILRKEHWSGLPCPPPGDLPNPGIEPQSPALQADSLPTKPPGKPALRYSPWLKPGVFYKANYLRGSLKLIFFFFLDS